MIEVVNCVRALVARMPRKAEAFVNFLSKLVSPPASSSARAKRVCVEAIHAIATKHTHAATAAMQALAEFVEDCTSTSLSCSVLQILAEEVPRLPASAQPALFVHAIYNRVLLEKAEVRVAALSALARIARNLTDPALRASLRALVASCANDPDDELRERAALLSQALEELENPESTNQELFAFALGERTFDVQTLEERVLRALEEAEPDMEAVFADVEVDTKDALAMAALSRQSETEEGSPEEPAK